MGRKAFAISLVASILMWAFVQHPIGHAQDSGTDGPRKAFRLAVQTAARQSIEQHPDAAISQFPPLENWVEENWTPRDLTGIGITGFVHPKWRARVSAPTQADAGYDISVIDQSTGWFWQGRVDAAGVVNGQWTHIEQAMLNALSQHIVSDTGEDWLRTTLPFDTGTASRDRYPVSLVTAQYTRGQDVVLMWYGDGVSSTYNVAVIDSAYQLIWFEYTPDTGLMLRSNLEAQEDTLATIAATQTITLTGPRIALRVFAERTNPCQWIGPIQLTEQALTVKTALYDGPDCDTFSGQHVEFLMLAPGGSITVNGRELAPIAAGQ